MKVFHGAHIYKNKNYFYLVRPSYQDKRDNACKKFNLEVSRYIFGTF